MAELVSSSDATSLTGPNGVGIEMNPGLMGQFGGMFPTPFEDIDDIGVPAEAGAMGLNASGIPSSGPPHWPNAPQVPGQNGSTPSNAG